jgi:hypothetical protein
MSQGPGQQSSAAEAAAVVVLVLVVAEAMVESVVTVSVDFAIQLKLVAVVVEDFQVAEDFRLVVAVVVLAEQEVEVEPVVPVEAVDYLIVRCMVVFHSEEGNSHTH